MLNKREFLKGAAAIAAASGAVWPLRQSVAAHSGDVADIVVFNDRYRDAHVFAGALARRGALVLPINGDPGELWISRLRGPAASGTLRIAGMGAPSDLFILETLGRDAGLRLHFRGEHDGRRSRTLTHRFTEGVGTESLMKAVTAAGESWPVAVAAAVTGRHGVCRADQLHACVATNIERSKDHPGLLMSWLLA